VWSDLACFAVRVVIGMLIEQCLRGFRLSRSSYLRQGEDDQQAAETLRDADG